MGKACIDGVMEECTLVIRGIIICMVKLVSLGWMEGSIKDIEEMVNKMVKESSLIRIRIYGGCMGNRKRMKWIAERQEQQEQYS